MKTLKIAYCAGHCLSTAGKRLPKALDADQTREWVLNDRVARAFAQEALTYGGVQLLRTDDPTGKADIPIRERTAKANAWGADIYLDFHHNAGINLGSGGGVVAFCFPGSEEGARLRDAIYAAVTAAGGLKGNRSQPLQEKRFDTLRYADMPAALIEYGFMDSRTDAPVILTEAYSQTVGIATMAAVAQLYDLEKLPAVQSTPAATTTNKNMEVCTVEVKVLKKGTKGGQVKAMQLLLIGNGCSCGSKGADGSFGPATDTAVRAFQKKTGLTVDGSCGPKTWAKLLGVG